MAGLYPDVPNNRIAYDLDGTQLVESRDGTTIFADHTGTAVMNNLNSETTSTVLSVPNNTTSRLMLIFPVPMNITGIFRGHTGNIGGGSPASYSTDTTNGVDGTWTGFTNPTLTYSIQTFRQNITAVSLSNVKGIRGQITLGASSSVGFGPVHIYGRPASLSNRLEFWDPSASNRVAANYFDLAEVPRGSTIIKTFRIKNLSTTLQANSVNITSNALTGGTTWTSNMTFSSDGITYTSSLNIGNLAADAISGTLYVKLVVPSNGTLSLAWVRANAAASSWT